MRTVTFARLLAAAGVLAAARPAAAGNGSGSLAGETYIHSRFPGNNNGGCVYVNVGRDNTAGLMRGLIQFSLPLPVPGYAGRATVTGVIVNNVTVRPLPNGLAGTVETNFLERLIGSFIQGNGCGAQSTGNYNAGVNCSTPTQHGATWNTSNCVTAWTAGGPVTGAPVPSTLNGSTMSWDSGGGGTNCASQPQLCTDVQAFIDGGVAIGGWRIRNTESVNGHSLTFTHSGTLNFTYACRAGYLDTGTTCTTCTAAARSACVTTCPSTGGTCTAGQPSGNTCNDSGPPSTTYTCNCANPAYTGTGTTACTDRNECIGNPCASGGDTSATCTDAVAPATGYSCTCNTGFTFNGTTCVSACSGGSNPCNAMGDAGSTCTVVGSGGWTCSCSTGYVSSGGTTPTCANFNACTAGGGNAACVTTCPATGGTCTVGQPSGNACNDLAPPSTSYTCTCSNAAYTGTGTTSCTDKNECIGSPCTSGGDASATCTDAVAPNIGYSCTCDAGFVSNGTSCVSRCPGTPDPCSNGGTCSPLGAGTWTCSCPAGFVSSGGSQPTCVPTVCGDGVVQGSEQCDNGSANGTAGSCCSATCTFVAANTVCLAPTGPCGNGARCTGSSATCPAETFMPSTAQCLAPTGPCGLGADCSGSSAACPAESFMPLTTQCLAPTGLCDNGANCTGSSAACPADTFKSNTTVCAVATDCLQAASCSGASDMCPAPVAKPDGTACMSGAGACRAGTCLTPSDGGMPDAAPPDATIAPDARATGGSGGSGGSAGMAGSGGQGGTTAEQPGGCGCEVGAMPKRPPSFSVLALLGLIAIRFRRSSRCASRKPRTLV